MGIQFNLAAINLKAWTSYQRGSINTGLPTFRPTYVIEIGHGAGSRHADYVIRFVMMYYPAQHWRPRVCALKLRACPEHYPVTEYLRTNDDDIQRMIEMRPAR
jgi:hypothetical protein